MRPVRETFAIGGLFSQQAKSLREPPGTGADTDASDLINLFDRTRNKSAPAAVYPRPGAL
jgi:hypothetical protein